MLSQLTLSTICSSRLSFCEDDVWKLGESGSQFDLFRLWFGAHIFRYYFSHSVAHHRRDCHRHRHCCYSHCRRRRHNHWHWRFPLHTHKQDKWTQSFLWLWYSIAGISARARLRDTQLACVFALRTQTRQIFDFLLAFECTHGCIETQNLAAYADATDNETRRKKTKRIIFMMVSHALQLLQFPLVWCFFFSSLLFSPGFTDKIHHLFHKFWNSTGCEDAESEEE